MIRGGSRPRKSNYLGEETCPGTEMLASRLLEADILYQTNALEVAAERLEPIAREVSSKSGRLASLCRLTEIACDLGRAAKARELVAEMDSTAARVAGALTISDRAELNYAHARYAFSARDGLTLERRARDAFFAMKAPDLDRAASLAIRINAYLAVDRYHRANLAGASAAARTAERALETTPTLPYFKTHVLTTRAVIDLHDPERAHLAVRENAEAALIALENGMTSTAKDALFNILNFRLFCDGFTSSPEAQIVRENLKDVVTDPWSADDPVLAAMALAAEGRYPEAIQLIGPTGLRSGDRSSGWFRIFFEPVTATKRARILFKAGRYAEAERAAAEAFEAWESSGLGGQGTALRVRAEALEALGQIREATAAIEDTIGALQSLRPVHHMVDAYRCAYRLTQKRAYLDQARRLRAALDQRTPSRRGSQLTPREHEIAALIAQGCTNKAIASRLKISPRTVENHVGSIFERLSIRARWQLTDESLQAHRRRTA